MLVTELLYIKKTLYVNRPLLNYDDIKEWAISQGFTSILSEDDMHVTIAYSKEKFNWRDIPPISRKLVVKGGERSIKVFGENAIVLAFTSEKLYARWAEFVNAGASWDYPQYVPHVTLSYESKKPKNIEPYNGKLLFGSENMSELTLNWSDNLKEIKL